MSAILKWATPNAEQMISDCARVSNPSNQGKDGTKLIKYLADNKHWSPFEMANICIEVNVTRDIARQLLRHRSFSFQEFSQRYAQATDFQIKPARLQDQKNRQNSLENPDPLLDEWWDRSQAGLLEFIQKKYNDALERGIAKEVARVILPEGLTMSRLYVNGTVRSWIHYLQVRLDPSTQKEHRELASDIAEVVFQVVPGLRGFLEESKVQ